MYYGISSPNQYVFAFSTAAFLTSRASVLVQAGLNMIYGFALNIGEEEKYNELDFFRGLIHFLHMYPASFIGTFAADLTRAAAMQFLGVAFEDRRHLWGMIELSVNSMLSFALFQSSHRLWSYMEKNPDASVSQIWSDCKSYGYEWKEWGESYYGAVSSLASSGKTFVSGLKLPKAEGPSPHIGVTIQFASKEHYSLYDKKEKKLSFCEKLPEDLKESVKGNFADGKHDVTLVRAASSLHLHVSTDFKIKMLEGAKKLVCDYLSNYLRDGVKSEKPGFIVEHNKAIDHNWCVTM